MKASVLFHREMLTTGKLIILVQYIFASVVTAKDPNADSGLSNKSSGSSVFWAVVRQVVSLQET